MAEMTEVSAGRPPAGPVAQLTAESLRQSPLLRQLAVMVGIAASVALGVAVVLWSQSPSYAPLYGSLADKDAAEVMDALQQSGVDFRVDETTGMLLVPSAKLQELRMQLASQGLPNGGALGFDVLQQDTGFGTSQLVESARYHHALEGELARTIGTLSGVQSVRVHLALPKQSVFVRKRKEPSASVVLKLFAGRVLEQGQVEAIVHLVASSVPEMEPGRVTVVDHKGRLLSEERTSREMRLSATQFEYTRKVEDHFQQRIEELLTPIVGADNVRAQVTADIDFTVTEQTEETYNPDQSALRSEQVNEEASRLAAVQGVPGALTNQPPAAAAAPEVAGAPGAAGEPAAAPLNTSKQATRNYELNRVVSHTRQAPASVRRLSVAVVVDDLFVPGAEGALERRERTPEEVERIAELVREAIGFDADRGDSVRVISSSFQDPRPVEPLPEPALWEETWFWDVLKQVGGVVVVLLVVFGVLRPALKRLTAPPQDAVAGTGGEVDAADGDGASARALGADGKPLSLPGRAGYENVLEAARGMVETDPKRVAQLVKTWMAEDGG
ncbi:MAG: flagellar basal-body MS-ring/collar protein FliF [Gammaproteobacteria bacterium]|jgi:flagellar M-ring protein FliF